MKHGDHKSCMPIQKPGSPEKGFQKPEERQQSQMVPPALFSPRVELLGPKVGKHVDPVQMLRDVPVSEMMNRALELLDLPLDHQSFMNILSFPPRPFFSEET